MNNTFIMDYLHLLSNFTTWKFKASKQVSLTCEEDVECFIIIGKFKMLSVIKTYYFVPYTVCSVNFTTWEVENLITCVLALCRWWWVFDNYWKV